MPKLKTPKRYAAELYETYVCGNISDARRGLVRSQVSNSYRVKLVMEFTRLALASGEDFDKIYRLLTEE